MLSMVILSDHFCIFVIVISLDEYCYQMHIQSKCCHCRSVEEDKIDLVNLDPVMSDYTMRCGTKLDFQILPKGPNQSVDIKITGENMYTEETDGYQEGKVNACR